MTAPTPKRKGPAIHWGGGVQYESRRQAVVMGRSFPCCCTGDKAQRIAWSGNQVFFEEEIQRVTCTRCRELLRRRVAPGPIAISMGVVPHGPNGETGKDAGA